MRFASSVPLSFILAAATIGCASGNCRQLANEQTRVQENPAPPAAAPAPSKRKKALLPVPAAKEETVLVYKYDGSLQCGMGTAIPVEKMEKEIAELGVQSREKKSDGMMHIQVCGQPTGMVNTYTIPLSKLPQAEKRGFRRWNFN